MDTQKRPSTALFDDELCNLIEKYSCDGLLTAGEIVGVLEFVRFRFMNKACGFTEDNEDENGAP
jgi:hypothetical protein